MNLTGRTAIISGGTGVLGSVVAEEFLKAGGHVAIPYHSEQSLQALSHHSAFSDRVLTSKADLSSEWDVASFVDAVTKKFERIDILVNAAGGYSGGKLVEETSMEEMEKLITLNYKTAFLLCRAVLPLMRRHRYGRIITIAAMPAILPKAQMGAYAVSKGGVITLTETIAEEVKGTGITANAIAPSIILTEANRKAMPKADFSKWVTPLEIARLILFLSSAEAGSVTGNVVRITGGV